MYLFFSKCPESSVVFVEMFIQQFRKYVEIYDDHVVGSLVKVPEQAQPIPTLPINCLFRQLSLVPQGELI